MHLHPIDLRKAYANTNPFPKAFIESVVLTKSPHRQRCLRTNPQSGRLLPECMRL